MEKEGRKGVDYISLEEYETLCSDNKMDSDSAAIWLKELHTIGTVVHFHKIKTLSDLIILNPEWLKEAAYRVLKRQAIRNNYGCFNDFSLCMTPRCFIVGVVSGRCYTILDAY